MVDLNACTNGVSPKHRLKSHFIRIGILHHNSLGKIEMQKYSDSWLIVNPKWLNWLRIKWQWWFRQFTEQYKWNYKLENARHLVALLSFPLVMPACCWVPVVVLPSRPLVTPPSCLLTSPLIILSLHQPLIVLFVVLPLTLIATPSRPLVAPPSCPLVMLPSHPLIARQLIVARPPSNDAAAIKRPRHRRHCMPSSSPTAATATTAATAAITCVVKCFTLVHWQRKRQQHHHH